MSKIIIDKEILKCAINDLTLNEIQATLEAYGVFVDRKEKKHQLVESILKKLENEQLSEGLYLAIKTKAFSTSSNFYDGFFYKYNIENIDFNYDVFMKCLEEQGENENSSKQSNITFEYKFYDTVHDSKNNIIKFTFFRESKKGVYDYKDDGVKFFHNKIQANIEIYYKIGLVYIHSKNSSESTTIKFLLQKAINNLLIDKKAKVKLTVPKFDNKIVEKWSRDNKFNVNGISALSIHMLDLLCEFESETNNFLGFSVKRIYLEHDVIDTKEDASISGLIVLGQNLQKRNEILLELKNGKKIKGFELEVNYLYEDEESGEEVTIIVMMSILQDNNNSMRISLSKESLNVKEFVLFEIYKNLREVFFKKINSKSIQNTTALIEFINKCNDIQADKGEEVKEKPKSRVVY